MISEGVQVPQRLPTETNHQGNQRLLLIINAAVEAKRNTITIKAAVKPAGGTLHHRIFMSMPGGSPLIKTAGFISSFKAEENSSMVAKKGGVCISFCRSGLLKPRITGTNGIHGTSWRNSGIRKYTPLDGLEEFIFPLPDWHSEYQLGDHCRFHEIA